MKPIQCKSVIGYLVAWCILITMPFCAFSLENTLSKQRTLYKKAEKYLKAGKIQAFHKILPKLKTYPLYPYLRYADLKRKIHRVDLDTFLKFDREFYYTPLVDKLRQDWLFSRAKQKKWAAFLQVYQPNNNVALQCHYLNAKYHLHANKNIFKKVPGLWLHGTSRPKACNALFDNWEKEISISRPLLWQRIKLSIKARQFGLARYLAKNLNPQESKLVELWIKVQRNPHLIRNNRLFREKHPAIVEIILHGMSEIARKNPTQAIHLWKKVSKNYTFNKRHWAIIVREIGLSLASKRHPHANKWLSKVPSAYLNANVFEWGVRANLVKEDWQSVLTWINKMPKSLAQKEEWQYWFARSLENTGQKSKAAPIFDKLSRGRSYYGFLSSLRIIRPYQLQHKKVRASATLLKHVARLRSVKRARELHKLGKVKTAKSEWLFALKKMTEKERLAAARLAFSWNLPNWSIVAISKAENKNDLELRFPKNHAKHIFQAARKHAIDPAWIFAVTRQESGFVPRARSSAGALGLMQMIPSTAREVAQKINIPLAHRADLFQAKKNIAIGSAYLKMLLEKNNNNAVLATASYNAGPNRVQKWIPEKTVSADTWIETIPYKETRNFVKNVLTYTIIYQKLLGHKPILQDHLPLIIVGKSDKPPTKPIPKILIASN